MPIKLNTLQCFVRNGDKYLMLHRNPDKRISPGVWMAPGGKREFNEGLFACARREVREETGLEIKNIGLLCHGTAYAEDLDMELYFHFLEADLAGGELHLDPPDGELRWVTLPQMLALDNLLSEFHHVLPLVLKPDAPFISYRATYSLGNRLESIEIEEP